MASRKQLARQVMAALDEPLDSWEFKSSSSNALYTVLWHKDHHISCNCRGWTFKRGAIRVCQHTQNVRYSHFQYNTKYRLTTEGDLEYAYPKE